MSLAERILRNANRERLLTLRNAGRRRFLTARLSSVALAALLLLALPLAADAYTLVLRSGRRVQIPDAFKVTPAAVVYEASPGFTVTVWLSNVDAAATEKANAEPAGSFAKRIEREQQAPGAASTQAAKAGPGAAPKTVTNRELEPSRLRREAQEAEYERTRRERGMPSRRELQRRVEEQDERLREWARQAEAERLAAEVESLRTELTHVRRQLNGLSHDLTRREEGYEPAFTPFTTFNTFTTPYVYPHVYPYAHPYVYAPHVLPFNVFPHVRRGPFGRHGFGLRPHAPANTSPGAWDAPRAMPPAGRAHGRPR